MHTLSIRIAGEKTIQRLTLFKQIMANQNMDVVSCGMSCFLSDQI